MQSMTPMRLSVVNESRGIFKMYYVLLLIINQWKWVTQTNTKHCLITWHGEKVLTHVKSTVNVSVDALQDFSLCLFT